MQRNTLSQARRGKKQGNGKLRIKVKIDGVLTNRLDTFANLANRHCAMPLG
jgi:hypothetical protein